jgi:serpin B
LSEQRYHAAINALDLALPDRKEESDGAGEDAFRLTIVNAAWGREGYTFLESYLDTLGRYYGAGINMLDFNDDPEYSRQRINDYIERQTEKRISNLLPSGSVTRRTAFILTNAVYFKAAWMHPFDENRTSTGPFFCLNGEENEVAMMHRTGTISYADADGYETIELPYKGGDISMMIILPDRGAFDSIEKVVDHQRLKDIITSLRPQRVRLSMPKWEYESGFSLVRVLTELGMSTAFTEDANFSGIDGTKKLAVSDVFHNTFVAVDEKGTEAAAATGVVVGITSIPPKPPVTVQIDRPFLYVIRDVRSGAILFLGTVVYLEE